MCHAAVGVRAGLAAGEGRQVRGVTTLEGASPRGGGQFAWNAFSTRLLVACDFK